jgi:hypothetical protein
MLPEWHEQLRSGDQGFLFRAMVTTDSAEVTGIKSKSNSKLVFELKFVIDLDLDLDLDLDYMYLYLICIKRIVVGL